MNTLQKALIGNAIFSTTSAFILLLFSRQVQHWFGVQLQWPFWIIGLGLIFFAGTIFMEIKRQRKAAVYAIIIQDILWVLGSMALLLLQPFGISNLGNGLIAIVALIVLLFAIFQYCGLRKTETEV